MTQLRFLLDDAGQSQTQKAVLSAFASDLEERTKGEIVWSSQLPETRQWEDVPAESSRRLGLRLMALEPAPGLLTVFLPGHIVPGEVNTPHLGDWTLATSRFSTVADLDLFVVDNAGNEVQQYQDFVLAHPDYEAASSYAAFRAGDLPGWLVSAGLTSSLKLTERPWYTAFSPARAAWLGGVRKALEQNRLTLSMVEDDVRNGLVRPSLLEEVRSLSDSAAIPEIPDLTLDSLFASPERRLTVAQQLLLHSPELQARTLQYATRKAAHKLARQQREWHQKHPVRSYIKKVVKKTLKFGYHVAYAAYAASLRPLVKRLRQKGGITQ